MMNIPLVSICCITYNHAQFIRQCLDGFLMQKGVDYEILIHDDCSTDGTIEIIRRYADKYPNVIFPMYEKKNLFHNGRANEIDYCNYKRARGKYIAYCEGDDYWTNPFKLQMQVEWMEAHEDYTVSFHDFLNYNTNTSQMEIPYTNEYIKGRIKNGEDGIDISMMQFFSEWITMPLTMMFRRDAYDPAWHLQYRTYRDTHEIYHLMKQGKCRLLRIDGAVRIRHAGGLASFCPVSEQIVTGITVAEELYFINHDAATKQYYISMLEWAMSNSKPYSRQRIKFALKHWYVKRDFTQLIKNIKNKK